MAEDFTLKVREARRMLGTHLVRARSHGHTASMKFDKLVVDDIVYKYDTQTQKPVRIRPNTAQRTRDDTQSAHPFPWSGQPRDSISPRPSADNTANDPEHSDTALNI